MFTCPYRSYTPKNDISQICYCAQISLQKATVNCSFCDNLTPLGVPFILLVMVHFEKNFVSSKMMTKYFYKLPYPSSFNAKAAPAEERRRSCDERINPHD